MKNHQVAIEEFPSLPPLAAFDFIGEMAYGREISCKKPFLLPKLSDFHNESDFADVAIAWNEKSLLFSIDIKKPFEEASFSDYENGDSIELFIDTRDVKTAATITRFCHHFLILPLPVEGVQAKEITRFRGEESHPLCDPDSIQIQTDFGKRGYTLNITLTEEALYGYAPDQVSQLGFTYKINRCGGSAQHFSASSKFFSIHLHPKLWASFSLKQTKEKG